MKAIRFGTFAAERFWDDASLARLPRVGGIADSGKNSMDELLCGLCQGNDILCTYFELPSSLREYHESVGLIYESQCCLPTESKGTIGERLLSSQNEDWLRQRIQSGYRLEPYAVLPCTDQLFRKLEHDANLPALSVVSRVNSKVWSHDLRKRLGYPLGCIAYRTAEFASESQKILKHGALIVKEPYGVSGTGSITIETQSRYDRILKHLRKEEDCGRSLCLILEPFLKKAFDFSIQVHINSDGSWRTVAFTGMQNNGSAFEASCFLTPAQRTLLAKWDFDDFIAQVVESIWAEGYFGAVGIDAMALADGTLAPLVEVNARVTIGLINQQLDSTINLANGRKSYLTFMRFRHSEKRSFQDLFNHLTVSGALFHPRLNPDGVIPLTANTLVELGRVYFSVPYSDSIELDRRMAIFKLQLRSSGW